MRSALRIAVALLLVQFASAQQPAPPPRIRYEWRAVAAGYTQAGPNGGVLFRVGVTDQSGTRIIAENGAAGPAWSPDGEKVAFCGDEDPNIATISTLRGSGDAHIGGLFVNMLQGLIVSSSWFSSIVVANADGTAAKKIFKAKRDAGVCEPAWSPDGKQIAYTAYHSKRSDIYIMTADGADSHLVTEGYRPQWSPDGRQLTFFRARKGPGTKSSIWVVNSDGSGLRSLTDYKSISWTPTWTRDGRILFASDRDGPSAIYAVNPDGSGLRVIASPADWGLRGGLYAPRPSPDGKQLLVDNYTFRGANSFIIMVDGSHRAGHLPVICATCLDMAVRWEHD